MNLSLPLSGPKSVTEVTEVCDRSDAATASQLSARASLCPPEQWNYLRCRVQPWDSQAQLSLTALRSLENRWRLTSQALSTGRETPSRPFEPGSIHLITISKFPKIHTINQFKHLPIVAPPSLHTVHISDVLSGKCSVSVHSTHFWCTVLKMFSFCSQYTFLMYRQESFLLLFTVHISDVPSWKCSLSVHSTHFWCTVKKVFCFCSQYTFLMYRLENVLFLFTVHISDVPSRKCSVSVHSTHF